VRETAFPCSQNLRRSLGYLGALTLLGILASGCLTTRSYVDPALGHLAYSDLTAASAPRPVHLVVDFQTRGKRNLAAANTTYDRVSSVLRSSGLFSAVQATAAPDAANLEIVMNNVGDIGKAVSKGIGTGLTLGLVGSMVTDGYEFTATYTAPGKPPVTKTYQHALHTTVGNKQGPPGLKAMSTNEAFDQVVEDLVLHLLRDLEKDGVLGAS